MLGKALGIAALAAPRATTAAQISHLLTRGVRVLILTIIGAILGCLLIAVALFAAYIGLVQHGMEPMEALGLLALGIALLAGSVAAMAAFQLKELHESARAPSQPPAAPDPLSLVHAFLDGYGERRRVKRT